MNNHFSVLQDIIWKHIQFSYISVDLKIHLISISISVDLFKYKNHVYVKTGNFFHKFIGFVEISSQAAHNTNK